VLTSQQMREIDRVTVERCGIPYPTLMETAGTRVVEAIIGYGAPINKSVFSVFCGKGNNGGDGAVVARQLWMRGAPLVCVYLFGRINETKGEARINFDIISQIYEEERKRANFFPRLSIQEITEEEDAAYISDGADVVVDALLGTGLTRPAEGLYAKAIESINHRRGAATIVSVDIPSGLSSDAGQLIGPRVQADLTVSFTAPKIGNVLAPASEYNGNLVIAPIGTPNWLIDDESGYLHIVEEKQIAEWLQASRRSSDAHKGSVGDVLLIAGSRGKTGAAALSSETILRAGAGLVTVATADSAQPLLVTQARTEVMTEALDETPGGAISSEALDRALRLARERTVIAIGPGLSSSDESTRDFVREMVEARTAPMVIDADGLNALAPWPEDLKGLDQAPIIITPHPGEMARLVANETGWTTAEIVADRIDVAREFATRLHIITVLKGNRTIIASPGGEVYVNPTGNAGMATAGSGDVLTGLVAGLLAQRPSEPLEATIAAVYLHGLAGDLAVNNLGMRPLVASDIIANLSEAMLQAGGDAERGQTNKISTI
ncbi:MAG: NAD(P)H-hydrate dehydratase, partial [Chloracidobacterium sp.]|nr:NAD(P)H-hydrate dehydratase [Chloracidobacterium sp.]